MKTKYAIRGILSKEFFDGYTRVGMDVANAPLFDSIVQAVRSNDRTHDVLEIVRVEVREAPAGRKEAPLEDPRPGAKYALRSMEFRGKFWNGRGDVTRIDSTQLFSTTAALLKAFRRYAAEATYISEAAWNDYEIVKVYETTAGTTRVLGEVVA